MTVRHEPGQIRNRIRERLAEQRALVQRLLRLREQLRGSLFARYLHCGKEACACRQGKKHGPYYVLSTRARGMTAYAHIQGSRAKETTQLIKKYREFREGMRRLKRLNADLVQLLQRYQETMTQQTGKRLGLSAEARQ